MAQTALTATTVKRSGTTVTAQTSDETNGNYLPLTGYEMLDITNTDSGSHSITFVAQSYNSRGVIEPNITVAISAGAVRSFGPFQKADWANASGNLIISYSAGTAAFLSMRITKNLVSNQASDTES